MHHGEGVTIRVLRWVCWCALAESVGMTAASGAAKAAQHFTDTEFPSTTALLIGLGLVIAGGLVEGTALGLAQVQAFRPTHPRIQRRTFLAWTIVVAGLGWAAASAPSVLAGPGDGSEPPRVLVVLGGAGLGLLMGPLLGLAQSLGLRRAAAHPRSWIVANTLGWVPAMAVIFLGATTAAATWSWVQVTLLGTATGAIAGAALGLVLGVFVPRLGIRDH